jgi:hypothetical protein
VPLEGEEKEEGEKEEEEEIVRRKRGLRDEDREGKNGGIRGDVGGKLEVG